MNNNAPQISNAIHELRFTSSALDDIEGVKNMQRNRLRVLVSTEPDEDGIVRGFGLPEDNRNVIMARSTVESLEKIELGLIKELQAQMKHHPFGGWVRQHRGVGEKQIARLLSLIGDPYWRDVDVINTSESSVTLRDGTVVESGGVKYPAGPRTVRQLWAYCGVHTNAEGTAARRTKGVQANWNNEAKTRAYLVIASCMKQLDPQCKSDTGISDHKPGCNCSKYRVVVDNRRLHTLETHPDWSPMHSLNDGTRYGIRALLKDLYEESKRIHEGGEYEVLKPRKLKAVA